MIDVIIGLALCGAGGLLLYAIRYRATEPQPMLLRSDIIAYTLILVVVILAAVGLLMIVSGLLPGGRASIVQSSGVTTQCPAGTCLRPGLALVRLAVPRGQGL
jgi:multisubunit Na+/H+ antiporter MnhC subunit